VRTIDGGAHWDRAAAVGVIAALTGVWFADADTGTAVGYAGTILRTDRRRPDVGATGRAAPSLDLFDVFFTDTEHGSVVGEAGTVLRTLTGGVLD
jgi:photosystem II stability/assembly factor-like uncharacterized protein